MRRYLRVTSIVSLLTEAKVAEHLPCCHTIVKMAAVGKIESGLPAV